MGSTTDTGTEKKIAANRAIAAVIAVAIVVVSVILFIAANTSRIDEQNDMYLTGSTEQTARRVNDLLERSLDIVETAAAIYEGNITSSEDAEISDPSQVAAGLKIVSFDYTFFVTPDGTAYRHDGVSTNASHMGYYEAGMRGESGIAAYTTAAFSDQNVLVFWAPIAYNGEVLGIFAGAYREDTISDYYMSSDYFGTPTSTYLCAPDGLIVARSNAAEQSPETLKALLDGHETTIGIDELSQDLENGRSTLFRYSGDDGSDAGGSVYLTRLENFDWMLMRVFPQAITAAMIENASMSGFIVLAGVAMAAAFVMAVLAVQARRKRETLLFERQNAERIIDTTTELFHSVLTVRLSDGEYEYLAPAHGMRNIIPDKGKFPDLVETLVSVSEGDYQSSIVENLSFAHMRSELAAHKFYQFEQHLFEPERNGAESWMQASVMELERNGAGELEKVLIAVQDTTKVKKRELDAHTALMEAYRAAEYASKAKSDFLNSMSHDIRTPMNSIMGLTAIAGMHVDEPARVSECLSNISAASHHLLGLINEVLDMAKIESGNISLAEEDFDLSELVEGILTIVHPQIESKRQTLSTELADIRHELVCGDSTRLQQVLVNILGNAVKFTPEGGTITIRIRELESRIARSACFEFQIEDTGVGMSPEFLKTIFEPFARANDSRVTKIEGTGLGMSIVKSVVDMMNGTIDVESQEGIGTKFTVVIHLALQEHEEQEAEKISGRAFVIDDEENTCRITCEMLHDIGMECSYETDGRTGVKKVVAADNSGDPYDVIMIDWKMPGISGIEAARDIREKTEAKVPIIIFSGYDWTLIEEEAKRIGVDAFVMKPLFRSRLVKLLRGMLTGEGDTTLDKSQILEDCKFEGRRVLLTEDNPMAAEIARELIEMTGAEVDHAENGQIAYEKLRDSEPGHYDMVLMDIQMPVMNGYEATRSIREESANGRPDLERIPIIALSADAFIDDIKRAHASGMNAHMSKPLEIDTLVKMLTSWIGGQGDPLDQETIGIVELGGSADDKSEDETDEKEGREDETGGQEDTETAAGNNK